MKKSRFFVVVGLITILIIQSPKSEAQTIQIRINKVDMALYPQIERLKNYSNFHDVSIYHKMEWRNGIIVTLDTLSSSSIHILRIYSNNKLRLCLYSVELDTNWYILEGSENQKQIPGILKNTIRQIERQKLGKNVP